MTIEFVQTEGAPPSTVTAVWQAGQTERMEPIEPVGDAEAIR